MFIFELFYKEMLPRNEHLVSAINDPEIKSKLSDQTVKKIKNFNVPKRCKACRNKRRNKK